ncbi:MAG: hypothetical protein DI626_04730 [Micavibrio aeruginosavorus]|uniref:Polysaccharide biosynthesis protein C-terminal domain-containing protein n=1 Tax=Micavibrio aeruginosavorus TaxID=349221 RepID=A0A2W5A3V2_9BACT|nr:MAG: hypothetical protein DI626_04730 [Micavibrio aeruginosavorus]
MLLTNKIKGKILANINLLEGVALNFGFKVFQIFLGLTTTYFIVRSLSSENYGNYNYILTVVSLLSVFSLPGMSNAITQSIARGYYGTYTKALSKSFKSSLLGSFALGSLSFFFFLKGEETISFGLIIASFFFPFSHGLDKWKAHLLGEEKYRRNSILGFSNITITAIFIVALCLIKPGETIYLLIAIWLVPSIQNIIQNILIRKNKINKKIEEGNISYGIKTSFYAAIGAIAINIDKLLIFHFLSPEALAAFVVAQKIPELIKSGIQDIGQILLPKFSRHEILKKKIITFFKVFSFTLGGFILVFSFTIYPYIFSLIFGDNYQEAVVFSQILMVSVAIANAATLKVWFINSKLDARSYRDVILISSVGRIILSFCLVPIYGIWGAVASAFAQRIFSAIAIDVLLKKRFSLEE